MEKGIIQETERLKSGYMECAKVYGTVLLGDQLIDGIDDYGDGFSLLFCKDTGEESVALDKLLQAVWGAAGLLEYGRECGSNMVFQGDIDTLLWDSLCLAEDKVSKRDLCAFIGLDTYSRQEAHTSLLSLAQQFASDFCNHPEACLFLQRVLSELNHWHLPTKAEVFDLFGDCADECVAA